MNLFEALMLSKKITFREGKVKFYEQDVLLIPYAPLIRYMVQLYSNTESIKSIYHLAKEAILENRDEIKKAYGASKNKNWICDVVNLFGQGKITYENYDDGLTGIIKLENNLPAKNFEYGTINPTDHILRGLIAGIISAILDKDIDAVEMDCHYGGNSTCKFFVDTKEKIEPNFTDQCDQQL